MAALVAGNGNRLGCVSSSSCGGGGLRICLAKWASVSSSTSVSVLCAVCDDGIGSYVWRGKGASVSIEFAGALAMYDTSKDIVARSEESSNIVKSSKRSCAFDGSTARQQSQIRIVHIIVVCTYPCR